jgi:hypothetical protein
LRIRSSIVLFVVVTFACLVAGCKPIFCQEPGSKFVFSGVGIDAQSTPQAMGMGGIALPIGPKTLSYTDYDVSVIPGDTFQATMQQVLQGSGLQFSIRTGIAQQVFVYNRFSVYGLLAAGVAAGGVDTVTKGSFAGGGLVDVALSKNIGLLIILQEEKNVSPTGFRFIPRLAFRYRF